MSVGGVFMPRGRFWRFFHAPRRQYKKQRISENRLIQGLLRFRAKQKPPTWGDFRCIKVCPLIWRREWDSNPRRLAARRFSRPFRYDHFGISPQKPERIEYDSIRTQRCQFFFLIKTILIVFFCIWGRTESSAPAIAAASAHQSAVPQPVTRW